MPGPFEISVDQLTKLIGTPSAPVIVDLRIEEDFAQDETLVPGSVRWDFEDFYGLRDFVEDRHTVTLCHKGRKISQGVAAQLRSTGVSVDVLEGGHVTWREAGAPVLRWLGAANANDWVTRQRPKVDRIACPWLIRRFVNPNARILFVPATDVSMVAERFDATPFDVEAVQFSHHGSNCSFDAFLQEFELDYAPLKTMAEIVRAADTNRLGQNAEASGLLAVLLGLSRMYRDDYAQLEAGMTVCDALFRWARDAQNESHDWPNALSAAVSV
ncbi:MAG: sulfurtransferase/chromate resistance protein [Pseudomonadota bacterium]